MRECSKEEPAGDGGFESALDISIGATDAKVLEIDSGNKLPFSRNALKVLE
jgi:hypothetical protein